MALRLQDSSFYLNMSKDKEILDSIADKEYEHGFVTDVEQEFIPKGLNEDIIRLISAKKDDEVGPS